MAIIGSTKININTSRPNKMYNSVVLETPSILFPFENKDFTLAKAACIWYLKSPKTARRFNLRNCFLLPCAAYNVSNNVARIGAIVFGVDELVAGIFSTVAGTSVELNAI